MVNGAFFVPSGEGLALRYDEASSLEAKSAVLIDQLTMNAGVMIPTRYAHLGCDLSDLPTRKNLSIWKEESTCVKVKVTFLTLIL